MTSGDALQPLFVTAPQGMEDLLLRELTALGAQACRGTRAGVACEASLQVAYAICLGSRLANRVLLPLGTWEAPDTDALYAGAYALPWPDHLDAAGSFTVDVTLRQATITHSHFAALRIKDAIVDQFRDTCGERPNVDRELPDVRFHVHVFREVASASIELSGGSLHQRGIREAFGPAPLKENLAAAVLMRSGWPHPTALLDPMCGTGTLLIEAVLMSLQWAPGLLWATRERPCRSPGWRGHQPTLWQAAYDAAAALRDAACADPRIIAYGSDIDARCVQTARTNVERAGLSEYIVVTQADVADCRPPQGVAPGHVVVNPPYGERMGDVGEVMALHARLGDTLRSHFVGWHAHVLTLDENLGKSLGMHATRVHALFNGAIPCKLVHAPVEARPALSRQASAETSDFANRLRKNMKRLAGWAKTHNVHCYRVYDADIPEYAVAVDRYEHYVHVQEYAPPQDIPPSRAESRLRDVVLSIPGIMQVDPAHVYLKVRQRQRGTQQYERLDARGNFIKVREGEQRFWVNFTDYLDTGLFLDHRPMRSLVGKLAAGKRFLNLFGYTGTASITAAAGGAVETTTVDLSRTYLGWAQQNFKLNGLNEQQHALVQADCFTYLRDSTDMFDLILLDPPTFSNSKRMESTLDIQRDHVALIDMTMRHLRPGGVLLFSTNMRRFKLDAPPLAKYQPTDITDKTIDADFTRNQRIHKAFRFCAA
jgi:23S rRNA (guanine2445-N2)-methyltransferase / 23S rRNA (guanine2069-N7)-methyltransferase